MPLILKKSTSVRCLLIIKIYFYFSQYILIASYTKIAVPCPATLSMFSVNSQPLAYIFPSPKKVSFIHL